MSATSHFQNKRTVIGLLLADGDAHVVLFRREWAEVVPSETPVERDNVSLTEARARISEPKVSLQPCTKSWESCVAAHADYVCPEHAPKLFRYRLERGQDGLGQSCLVQVWKTPSIRQVSLSPVADNPGQGIPSYLLCSG